MNVDYGLSYTYPERGVRAPPAPPAPNRRPEEEAYLQMLSSNPTPAEQKAAADEATSYMRDLHALDNADKETKRSAGFLASISLAAAQGIADDAATALQSFSDVTRGDAVPPEMLHSVTGAAVDGSLASALQPVVSGSVRTGITKAMFDPEVLRKMGLNDQQIMQVLAMHGSVDVPSPTAVNANVANVNTAISQRRGIDVNQLANTSVGAMAQMNSLMGGLSQALGGFGNAAVSVGSGLGNAGMQVWSSTTPEERAQMRKDLQGATGAARKQVGARASSLSKAGSSAVSSVRSSGVVAKVSTKGSSAASSLSSKVTKKNISSGLSSLRGRMSSKTLSIGDKYSAAMNVALPSLASELRGSDDDTPTTMSVSGADIARPIKLSPELDAQSTALSDQAMERTRELIKQGAKPVDASKSGIVTVLKGFIGDKGLSMKTLYGVLTSVKGMSNGVMSNETVNSVASMLIETIRRFYAKFMQEYAPDIKALAWSGTTSLVQEGPGLIKQTGEMTQTGVVTVARLVEVVLNLVSSVIGLLGMAAGKMPRAARATELGTIIASPEYDGLVCGAFTSLHYGKTVIHNRSGAPSRTLALLPHTIINDDGDVDEEAVARLGVHPWSELEYDDDIGLPFSDGLSRVIPHRRTDAPDASKKKLGEKLDEQLLPPVVNRAVRPFRTFSDNIVSGFVDNTGKLVGDIVSGDKYHMFLEGKAPPGTVVLVPLYSIDNDGKRDDGIGVAFLDSLRKRSPKKEPAAPVDDASVVFDPYGRLVFAIIDGRDTFDAAKIGTYGAVIAEKLRNELHSLTKADAKDITRTLFSLLVSLVVRISSLKTPQGKRPFEVIGKTLLAGTPELVMQMLTTAYDQRLLRRREDVQMALKEKADELKAINSALASPDLAANGIFDKAFGSVRGLMRKPTTIDLKPLDDGHDATAQIIAAKVDEISGATTVDLLTETASSLVAWARKFINKTRGEIDDAIDRLLSLVIGHSLSGNDPSELLAVELRLKLAIVSIGNLAVDLNGIGGAALRYFVDSVDAYVSQSGALRKIRELLGDVEDKTAGDKKPKAEKPKAVAEKKEKPKGNAVQTLSDETTLTEYVKNYKEHGIPPSSVLHVVRRDGKRVYLVDAPSSRALGTVYDVDTKKAYLRDGRNFISLSGDNDTIRTKGEPKKSGTAAVTALVYE